MPHAAATQRVEGNKLIPSHLLSSQVFYETFFSCWLKEEEEPVTILFGTLRGKCHMAWHGVCCGKYPDSKIK